MGRYQPITSKTNDLEYQHSNLQDKKIPHKTARSTNQVEVYSKDFIGFTRNLKVSDDYEMVPFDVNNLTYLPMYL